MSSKISSKQMQSMVYALVESLAGNYGFDADEAFEFASEHVDQFKKLGVPEKVEAKPEPVEKDEEEDKVKLSPLEKTRKNVALWTKKLEADKFKDEEARTKHIEKLEKERAKLAKLEPVVETKPVKGKAKKEAKPEEKEKRIKRFSPVMATQLKTALAAVDVEMTDSLKKEFTTYIEELSDDDYRKDGLADHMRAFAQTKKPVEDAEEEETLAKQEVTSVTIEELSEISKIAPVDPPGTYWDSDNGRFVKGPDADDDEDFEETEFNGKDYVVGEKTGRVYEARESGDVFCGFRGVGLFKGI
jgi:hypothetical protein